MRFGWDDVSASYQNDLPPGARDVTAFAALQFRASVNFLDLRNPEGFSQDFSVTLTDGGGSSVTRLVSDTSGALFFPPGRIPPLDLGRPLIPVPKIFLNTVRLPLSLFEGVDLADIQSVRFSFDQQSSGALLISDIAFAD